MEWQRSNLPSSDGPKSDSRHDEGARCCRALVKQIRQPVRHTRPLPDACTSYQALYRDLQEFEADLHQHVHLENNILFPRAVEMEAAIV